MQNDRRTFLLGSLSSAVLTACGGGGDDQTDAMADGAAAPSTSAAAPSTDVAATDTLETPDVTTAAEEIVTDGRATIQSAAVSLPGDPPQFLSWDAGSGPNRTHWSQHLQLPWKNPTYGDWLDAAGAPQGATPYAVVSVTTAGIFYNFPITNLVKKWVVTGENRGALLRTASTSAATWSGRTASLAQRPVLVVHTTTGTFNCPCLALASYAKTSSAGLDTRLRAKLAPDQAVIAQFDLRAVTGTVVDATMKLYCESKSSTAVSASVFELDPPRFQLGTGGLQIQNGVAASYPRDASLRSHPSIIRAGDFSNLAPGVLFDSYSFNPAYNPYSVLPDPDAPGTMMFRGSFNPSASGQARGSFTGRIETMRANYADPLRPPILVEEQMFCRLYIYLEDDWNSVLDSNKMAIGWDLRMGWWNDAGGGYWQSTTGNGGAPGTGMKVYAPAGKNGSSQRYSRWEYQGHAVRMEAGKGVNDGNPYTHLRPLQTYAYNLDQPTAYGQMIRLGNGVIGKGRWHCIEQQIKMNSIAGPYDPLGNGVAVPDGVIRTWLDGVLCSEVTNMRWRRHRDMGVQGPWVNWFYGGKLPTEVPMHYRMNHLAVSREYIGPRIA